jgi:cell division protein FtsB
MNIINKIRVRLSTLLIRSGARLSESRAEFEIGSLQRQLTELESRACDYSERNMELEAEVVDLREQIKELKRKLACKTAGEYYWRKQAKEARG